MSAKQTYVCDHCGAECSDTFEFSLFGRWARIDAQYIPDNVHGCTREHTILAVAKILGIGVDGRASELLTAKDLQIAELKTALGSRPNADALNTEIERQRGVIRSQNNEIARMQERIAALEARPDAAEVLQRIRRRALDFARPHGMDECAVVDVDTITNTIDAELASLTGPKKPTRPVVGPDSTLPFLERIGFIMKEWQNKSFDHNKHSIEARNAYSECADALEGELRKEDPKWCHACLNTGHNPLFLHNNCQHCAWKRGGK